MKGLFLACAAALAASPAVGQTLDVPPRSLEPHPDRESSAADGPYWVAASYAFMPDGAVRRAERIGATRRQRLVTKLESPRTRTAPDDTAPTELGCETSSEMAKMARELARFGKPIAYPPGDFRGWVAASDAVVLGTVTGFVPGFDQKGRPDTLVLLADTEHLYPSSEYPHFVKYVILPYARFVAGGMVFCAPSSFSTVEYYPEVGDRLLIAADRPADPDGLALTVMSRSRVVQVKDDGELLTYGRSDFDAAYGLTDVQPVDFSGFPVTVEEARKRAWHVWRDGFVDLADTLGHEEFTKAWRVLERQAARSIQPGCIVLGAHLDSTGWKMSASCTLSSEESADVERKQ